MAKRPISICHIIFRLDFGGLENGLVNLINNLPPDEFQHSIICLTTSGTFSKRIIRPGVRIVEAHKEPGKDLHAYVRVWKMIREICPDVVHTRNIPALDMLVAARFAGIAKLVHGEHGLDMLELGGNHKRYNNLRRLSRTIVSKYISVSADLARWLNQEIGISNDRIALIYNGVDSQRFSPGTSSLVLPSGFAPEDAFVLGTMGRLEPVKDQLNLARSFCRVLELRPDLRHKIRLILVGEGTLREQIERVLSEAGARELTWLPGFRDDSPELYRALNLFVLPSLKEGISNTLLEAMSSGLPVVATNVGGTPEILLEGATGTLVPANDLEAMAKSILEYIENPARAQEHGRNGRERVLQNFSLNAMVSRYADVYRSVASGS